MLKRLLLMCTGLMLLALGLIGLLLPFLPGVLFLILAVACFAAVSTRFSHRLDRNPQVRRWRARWRASAELSPIDRCRFVFWLTLSALLAPWRRGRSLGNL
jgi:uncharacterized membrane protein YbaN (DUF454 family)